MLFLQKKIKSNTFLKFFFYISIPVCVATLIIIASIFYFLNTNKNMLINNYNSLLSSIYTNNEIALKNIAQPISNLSDNNNFIQIVTGKTEDGNEIQKTQEKLKEIEKNNTFIDSISIIIRSDKKMSLHQTKPIICHHILNRLMYTTTIAIPIGMNIVSPA